MHRALLQPSRCLPQQEILDAHSPLLDLQPPMLFEAALHPAFCGQYHGADLILTMFDAHDVVKTFLLDPPQVQLGNHPAITDKGRLLDVIVRFQRLGPTPI